MKEILKGIIDMHVHAGPSVAKREVDAVEMLKEAVEAGYRGFLIKDHYFPTMMSAQLVEKHLGNDNVKVFGAIALNNSIGLFNLNALDAAYNMGAKIVYMPTVSSNQHIESHKGHSFPGSGNTKVVENPIIYVDENGKLQDEVIEVLKYVAERPDLILGTGHGSAREVDILVTEAVKLGVQKILVNHPFYMIGASMEQIAKWAKMGAYIELNACVFPPSKFGTTSLEVLKELLENVAIEQIVLDSDLGQNNNGSPVEGLYTFIQILMNDFGVTEEQINMMGKETPAKLLGI
jgi:hypothetical protein